jgi:phage terminase large subunit
MTKKVVQLNKVFKEANESRLRYKVLKGSAGSGKSYNTATNYILKLSDMNYKGANLLVVRSFEQSHRQSTFVELSRAIYALGLESVWEIKPSSLTMRNKITDSVIYFRGCSDRKAIERLKSITCRTGKLCWVWIEEATELRQSDVEIIDDRLRGELPNNLFYQITMTFNPVSDTHWIKTFFWDSTDENVFCCHSTYLDNINFIGADFLKRMERRKETDPLGYQIYGLGEWGQTEGLIFHNWEVGTYAEKDFENLTIGTDFGYNHNHASLLIGEKDGDIYILKECVCHEMTKGEIVRELARRSFSKDVIMWCDSAEPASIRELHEAGYKAIGVEKEHNSVLAQIRWLQDRRIFIDGRCVNTIKEFGMYRWQSDRTSGKLIDEPVKVDDDCIAALRYGIETYRKNKSIKSTCKGVFSL